MSIENRPGIAASFLSRLGSSDGYARWTRARVFVWEECHERGTASRRFRGGRDSGLLGRRKMMRLES